MKLTCDRDELAAALQLVQRIAATGVALEAGDGKLTLSVTDLELACRTSVVSHVDERGAAVPSARRLLELVRRLPEPDVSIACPPGGSSVRVSSGDAEYLLHGSDPADFPRLPVAEGERFDVDAPAFLATIARVVRAASTDLSRPVYTGVQMRIAADEITLVATDGYRLASMRTRLGPGSESIDVLVPARALGELMRLASGADAVRVTVSPNTIEFASAGATLWTRRLEGRPQDHEPILAGAFAHDARVPRRALLEAVERATLMVERNAPLELHFAGSELALHVRTPDSGEAHERLDLAAPTDPIRIGFNARYLRDGLELVEGEEVVFRINDGMRPVVLRGASDDFAYLVAPQRLAG